MKIWRNRHARTVPRQAVWIAAFLLYLSLIEGSAFAQERPAADRPKDPIHITSDRLVSDSGKRTAEFTGNVKVVQGQTTITADRLKLIYKSGDSDQAQTGTDSIDTIEAHGHVRIDMDNLVAESEKAVYTAGNQKLVLSGQGSKVTRGEDVIEGSLITFYRDSGRVEMVGDRSNPVKMTIRSEQRGLN